MIRCQYNEYEIWTRIARGVNVSMKLHISLAALLYVQVSNIVYEIVPTHL